MAKFFRDTLSAFGVCIGFMLASPAAIAVPLFTGVPTDSPIAADCEGFNCGFTFTANRDLSVNSLGAFDINADGLSSATEVGLWDAAGPLLASVTVPAGTGVEILDGYRYVGIAPVLLSAGMNYVVSVGGLLGDTPLLDQIPTVTFNPAITIGALAGRFSIWPPLRLPIVRDPRGWIYGGANLQFSAVPEPGILALITLGLGGIGFARRRSA